MGQDLEFAFELADLAASISLPCFRERSFEVRVKEDGSPVSDVDVEVVAALRGRIAERRPGEEVLGEEAGRSGRSGWRWYLDPIDGTSRFINGDPKWMTLIALAHEERITVGVVDLPAIGERWWAVDGAGAFRNRQPIHVSECATLAQATVNDTWREDLALGNDQHPLWRIAQRGARIRPHQGHSMLAVACGQADLAMQVGSFAWDYAPLKILVEQAGGTFTDLDGGQRIDTGGAIATNGRIHAEALRLLRQDT